MARSNNDLSLSLTDNCAGVLLLPTPSGTYASNVPTISSSGCDDRESFMDRWWARRAAAEVLARAGGAAAVKNACPCGTMKRPRPRPPRPLPSLPVLASPRPLPSRPPAVVLRCPGAAAAANALLGTAMGTAPAPDADPPLWTTSGWILFAGLRGLNLPA